MQDIRLIGNDGEYLNLETQAGDKFRLVLDDSLRAAIKRDSSVRLDSIAISPREIQDAIRAGATAEELSARHSVPLDHIEKFALTVVDEIGHIIASARAVRILIAADRYSDETNMEFGEVLSERISASGGTNIRWSAAKQDGSPWLVTVDYSNDGDETSAVWSFDQRKLVLSPENETAVRFSAGDFDSSISAQKLRILEPEVSAEISQTTVPTLAPVSSIEELTKASIEEFQVQLVETKVEEPLEDGEPEELTATADLLEALRRKRAATTQVASLPEEPTGEVESQVVEEVEPENIAPPAAKKGRPSMPSWDEIVFGTKTED